MSLLQVNSHSDMEEGSYVALQHSRRSSSLVLAGVVGSAALGAVCLGFGAWYRSPVTPETLETSDPMVDEVTTALTTSTVTLSPWFLSSAEFEAPDDEIELGSPAFGETTHNIFEVPENAIRTTEESAWNSVPLPPKGEGLAGLAAFYRAATEANGYASGIPSVMDTVTYDEQYGQINFMLGEVRPVSRSRLIDWASLELSSSKQRDMLFANPSEFIKKYGRYFVSQIIYGVGFAAQCSIDSPRAKQYAIDDVHDVFSESGPDLLLPGSFHAHGPFFPGPRRETEKCYATWKAEADLGKIRPLRPIKVMVTPFAEVQEIRDILIGLPAEQRKLFEVPRINRETLTRLVDEKAKVQYVISAIHALPATCEKTQLYEKARTYKHRLFHTDLAARQAEILVFNYTWFEGSDLLESLETLMQKCSP